MASSPPPRAFAYAPGEWQLFCDPAQLLRREDASYLRHVYQTLRFSLMQFVGGSAGFTHGFVAWLVPFAAEEISVELCAVVEEKREKGYWPAGKENKHCAFSPGRWVWFLNGWEHVKFSGGSYLNHGRFACWASGQFMVGAAASFVHAFLPFLLPAVGEEIMLQLGRLVRNRRMLRNADPDNTFVNPDNLNDYLGDAYEKRFAKAADVARERKEIGTGKEGFLEESRIAVQLEPGAKPQFILKD
uniref:Uncharacterized protein n=1 Tax=Phaeomonas parva TaxID=124430 RepID=A0A6U4KVQ2_9STRA|mmetsp:Transcript_6976/g.20388  ORF Transcript_6976/g.20388 Transcript_6976/m.20388 type:complete len:244 (+) Transcript_6976:105-836(+)